MIKLFTTKPMQEIVAEHYAALSNDLLCSIELFEWRIRRINILNMKIKQRSVDIGYTE